MTDQPMIRICGLYQNVSKTTGRTYFVGVCGGVKYLLLENTQAEEGKPGWNLCLTIREEKPHAPSISPPRETGSLSHTPRPRAGQSRQRGAARKLKSDRVNVELNDDLSDLLGA